MHWTGFVVKSNTVKWLYFELASYYLNDPTHKNRTTCCFELGSATSKGKYARRNLSALLCVCYWQTLCVCVTHRKLLTSEDAGFKGDSVSSEMFVNLFAKV